MTITAFTKARFDSPFTRWVYAAPIMMDASGTAAARRSEGTSSRSHVDFDHSLDVALSRLRGVIGDKGRETKLIEKLPTLGYRLLATPVEVGPMAARSGRRLTWRAAAAWLLLAAFLGGITAIVLVRRHYDPFVPKERVIRR